MGFKVDLFFKSGLVSGLVSGHESTEQESISPMILEENRTKEQKRVTWN